MAIHERSISLENECCKCCPCSVAFGGERLHAARLNCSFDLEHEPRKATAWLKEAKSDFWFRMLWKSSSVRQKFMKSKSIILLAKSIIITHLPWFMVPCQVGKMSRLDNKTPHPSPTGGSENSTRTRQVWIGQH